MAGDRGGGVAPVDHEVVALGLARDRLADGGDELPVIVATPERRPQIGGVLLPQAHIEGARAGEPHAVAGFAEIMRHRRDEADASTRLLALEIARGAAGAIVADLEGEATGELGAKQREREILLQPHFAADLAHRHDLDERDVESLAPGP